MEVSIVAAQSWSHVPLFVTPRTVAWQAPLSFIISLSLLKFMPIESVMLFNHLILGCPLFLLPLIFPGIRVFTNESVLRIRWPKYWSLSISPSMNIQSWFPLGLTGLISLKLKGLSGVFSSTTVWKHWPSAFFGCLLYGPTLTSTHAYWKNLSFDYMDICQQSDVTAF